MIQAEIDWSNITSQSQNNRESSQILEANLPKFNGQCKTVYDYLISGARLTVGEAYNNLHIGDLRARVHSLRRAGIDVKDELIDGRFKQYYL